MAEPRTWRPNSGMQRPLSTSSRAASAGPVNARKYFADRQSVDIDDSRSTSVRLPSLHHEQNASVVSVNTATSKWPPELATRKFSPLRVPTFPISTEGGLSATRSRSASCRRPLADIYEIPVRRAWQSEKDIPKNPVLDFEEFAHGRASSADSFRKVPSPSSAQASGASSSRASASSKRQLSAGHRPAHPSGLSSVPDGRQSSASRRGTINAPGPSDITVVGTVPPLLVNTRAVSHQPHTVQSGSATEATKRLSSVRQPSLFAEPSSNSLFSYDEGPSDDTASFFKFDKDLQFDLQEARNFMKTLQKESKVRFEALEGDAETADRTSTANRASARQDQQSRRRVTPRKVEEPPPPDITELIPTPQEPMPESKILQEPQALESNQLSELQTVVPTPATPGEAQAPPQSATPPSVELQLEPASTIASEPEPAPEQPEPQPDTVPEPIPEPQLEPLVIPPPSVDEEQLVEVPEEEFPPGYFYESNPTPAPSSVVLEYSRPVTAAEERVPPPPMRALKVHSPLPPPPAPSALILKPDWTVPEQRFVRAIATVSVGSLLRYVNHLKYQEQLDIIQARKYQSHDRRRSEERLGKFAIRERKKLVSQGQDVRCLWSAPQTAGAARRCEVDGCRRSRQWGQANRRHLETR